MNIDKLKKASEKEIREFIDGLYEHYKETDRLFLVDDGFCLSINSDYEIEVKSYQNSLIILFENGDGLDEHTRKAKLNNTDLKKMQEIHEWLKSRRNYSRKFFDNLRKA